MFKIDSSGVKNPSAKIPEIKAFKATPNNTNGPNSASSFTIILKANRKIIFNIARITDAKTISIRFSVLLTIFAEAIDEQRTKRQGTGWNDEINKTPKDIKIEKKTAELWLNKTVINIAAKVEGIIAVNANWDKKAGTFVANVVTA